MIVEISDDHILDAPYYIKEKMICSIVGADDRSCSISKGIKENKNKKQFIM